MPKMTRLTPQLFSSFLIVFQLLILLTHHDRRLATAQVAAAAAAAVDAVALRDLAPPSFHTGSVFHAYGDVFDDPDYRTLNLREFDGMTATIYMAYGPWESPNATIDTTRWKRVVDTLKANNKMIHGHVLVYPNTHLDLLWWQRQPDSLVETRMYRYIDTVAKAGKGAIWIWDVVNEVMGDDGNLMDADGVRIQYYDGRPIKEYQAMGQGFIAKAFQRAHAADPSALLLMTEYGIEEDDPNNNNDKADRLFRYVKKLKSQSVPIHGVGMQFHFSSIPGQQPNYTNIARNMVRFRNAGFSIYITELDVKSYETTDPGHVSSTVLRQAAARQAVVYAKVTKLCLNEPACKCLFMWDDAEYNSRKPNMKYSWLHPLEDGTDAAPVYGFPSPFWDINPNNFSPKPAWYAMRNELSNFTGTFRVASLWQPQNSYLARIGTSTGASDHVNLYPLNRRSSSWTSMKWQLERVDVALYRIACVWNHGTGYLSRLGVLNPSTQDYDPGYDVYLDDLHPDWWSQQWYVKYLYDNQYKITNRWGDGGTLTRIGVQDQNGVWQPTNQVNLNADNNWTSQIWRLERV